MQIPTYKYEDGSYLLCRNLSKRNVEKSGRINKDNLSRILSVSFPYLQKY